MNKKTIWITGGSTGIGKALAIKFANKGWNVAISARRENLLKEISISQEDYLQSLQIISYMEFRVIGKLGDYTVRFLIQTNIQKLKIFLKVKYSLVLLRILENMMICTHG